MAEKLTKRPVEDRMSMPVIRRYVRRLVHQQDQQYQSWKRANAGRLALTGGKE